MLQLKAAELPSTKRSPKPLGRRQRKQRSLRTMRVCCYTPPHHPTMILHLANPLDNHMLWLPCNMPLRAYLAMWAVISILTSLPVSKPRTTTQCVCVWRERGQNAPSQCDTQTEAQTRCDQHGHGKASSEEQLKGSTRSALPGTHARRLAGMTESQRRVTRLQIRADATV